MRFEHWQPDAVYHDFELHRATVLVHKIFGASVHFVGTWLIKPKKCNCETVWNEFNK